MNVGETTTTSPGDRSSVLIAGVLGVCGAAFDLTEVGGGAGHAVGPGGGGRGHGRDREAGPAVSAGGAIDLEWGRLDADGLRDAATGLQRVLSAVEHQQRRVLTLIDERRAFNADGSRDAADWAANRLGVSRATANGRLRLARQLEALPHLADAAARGQLSGEQARPAALLADPSTDRHWATQAPALPVGVLDRHATKHHQPTAADHRAARTNRHFRAWVDGLELRFRGALPVDDGHRLLAAIERTTPPAPPAAPSPAPNADAANPALTPDQRRADALLALASATITADHDPDRATIVLIADLDTIDAIDAISTCSTSSTSGTTGATELDDGTPVPVDTAHRLLCDSRVQVVVQDRNGIAVGVGTTSRTVSPGMRRVVMRRDGHCRFGSCTATRFLHAHHIDPWPAPTVLGNLTMVCIAHHHAVHEGGWRLHGNPNAELRATKGAVTVTSRPHHAPPPEISPPPRSTEPAPPPGQDNDDHTDPHPLGRSEALPLFADSG